MLTLLNERAFKCHTWVQPLWLLTTFFDICATLAHASSVSVKLIKSYELKLIKSREIINQVYLEQDVHLAEMPGRVKCQGNSKLWKFQSLHLQSTPTPIRWAKFWRKFFNSTGLIQTESTVDLLAGIENGRMALLFIYLLINWNL